MALSWRTQPCALKPAIARVSRHWATLASLPRQGGRSKDLSRVRAAVLASEQARHEQRRQNRPAATPASALAARAPAAEREIGLPLAIAPAKKGGPGPQHDSSV